MVFVLEEAQLRALVKFDNDALHIVEKAFAWTAEGKVDMPPIMHMSVPENNGDFDIKSAYVKGLDMLAVKLGSGFFDNAKQGLPNCGSTMAVMSTKTGFCQAILDENGYLTDLRTGMAGAVAAKYLAPKTIDAVGIIGAGVQGRFQLECLRLVRDFNKVYVHSRRQEQAEEYAAEMSAKLDIEVIVAASAEEVVRSSQLVVTTTPSREAIIKAEWLHPGLHITAMGADVGGKQELETDCLKKATLLVCDRAAQCLKMGELQHGVAAGFISEDSNIVELGEYASGQKRFKRSADDITICDLTGMGVQDTAIAYLAMEKYKALQS